MNTKGVRLALALVSLAALGPFALGNGLNLNSLGSRALAMGGAFTGLADDFSAVFWNPAGAAGFRQEVIGFFGTDLMPWSRYRLDAPAGSGLDALVSAKSRESHYLGGMLAYYRPVSKNLVLGFGVYTPSGGGSDWTATDFTAGGTTYDWSNTMGILSFSPLIAWKAGEAVWIGASLNLNAGKFSLNMPAGRIAIPVSPYEFDLGPYEESLSGYGLGATFGIMIKPSGRLSFGATVRTPSRVRFRGQASMSYLMLLGLSDSSDLRRTIRLPLWISGGLALRPTDRLVLTADVQWTGWKSMDEMRSEFTDSGWQALLGASGLDVRRLDWRNRTQVRFGAEYALSDRLALRAGYYHDPSPSPDTTMSVLLPCFTNNAFTAGAGWNHAGLRLDFGLEYLAGRVRTIDPAYAQAMPGRYESRIVIPSISVGYSF